MIWKRLRPLIFLAGFLFLLEVRAQAELRLITPAGYLNGIPFLVRVEARSSEGRLRKDLWDADVTLSVDNAGINLSTNRISLRNGLGTALLTITGTGDFQLQARSGTERAVRLVTDRRTEPVTTISEALVGASSTWSGVVRVTGDVVIPTNHVLTIESNALVIISGAASGTSGTKLTVQGAVRSLGTVDFPVSITSDGRDLNWGQIAHESSAPSQYQYTFISKAGRAPGEGHTGTGPAIRAESCSLVFDHSVISDLTAGGSTTGKIMMAGGSDLRFADTVLARARMGPEISGTGLVFTNSYVMEMRGPDDCDGIYLHDSGSRPLVISDSVFAGGDDDAIDTLNSRVRVENTVLRDWANPNEDAKGVSVFHGEVDLDRCLVVNCLVGVSAKSSGPLVVLRLDHCTVRGIERGVSAAMKANATAGNIEIYLTNSIVSAADALQSDFGADRFVTVSYCNLSEPWPGLGNQMADPLFFNAPGGDFHLLPGSPCIDAGDPNSSLDPDTTRTDVGFYSYLGASAPAGPHVVINEIMYHPSSEDSREEYIELFNPSRQAFDLAGWQFTSGVHFTFPSIALAPGAYLVVAADVGVFRTKYPGVTNVVGNWVGGLSNSDEDIDLDDASGNRVDRVHYADEGDWAWRRRGSLDRGHRGWTWFAEHDGLGKSLELINPSLSNNPGQNWAASAVLEGTPGRANSVLEAETAPFIEDARHTPAVPHSNESVLVTATISGNRGPLSATLHYRVDGLVAAAFQTAAMHDDGVDGDAAGGDSIFTAAIPAQTNNSVVEFYIEAVGSAGRTRIWPAAALASLDGTPGGQVNALYQVDDADYTGKEPLYKIIMTEAERAELEAIDNNVGNAANSDAQMNATFISDDGSGIEVRYLAGVRNRGHGSRTSKPNNFRVNFRSDQRWKEVRALNLNAQYSWLQVLGAALNLKSGIVGAYSRAVQMRVNNANLAFGAGVERTYGSYAANEVIDADWARRHFPDDHGGNVYRALRDLSPDDFDYRTTGQYPQLPGPEEKNSYTNTWFKTTNTSEDDWTDLIAMLRVMGYHGTESFTGANIHRVIDANQWVRHLAVMNLLGNNETGLNTGYNDDYFMYRGEKDRRFILMYYDLDTILGFNDSETPSASQFSSFGDHGAGRALERFLNEREFHDLYFETLRELIKTSFSAEQFNAVVDQVLGDFVPLTTRTLIKNWMDARRAYVLSQLPAPTTPPIRLVLSGAPRSPTPLSHAVLQISGENVDQYRYSLNGAAYSADFPISMPIQLAGLGEGTNTLRIVGGSEGTFQPEAMATTISWVVNDALPAVRLNEVIANRGGNLPDQIELFNEGDSLVDLAGLSLSDDPMVPDKFVFTTETLAAGGYRVIDAVALGFSLNADGEGVYLFDRSDRGRGLLDSVVFGPQLAGLSIGRVANGGEWFLTQPTFGSANVVQPLSGASSVVINEWLAAGTSAFPDGFVELRNNGELPAAIGGWFLTDQPAGAPTRSAIPPLSFLPGGGYAVFAGGDVKGTVALSFPISLDQGEIALLNEAWVTVDSVIYGPQQIGVSEGRCPDGGERLNAQQAPTPGGPNECPPASVPPVLVSLMPFDHVWKYDYSGRDLGTNWIATNYDDSAWASGAALLGFESSALPEPIRTPFSNPRVVTYYFRTTFRVTEDLVPSSLEITHLIDDGAAFYLNGKELGSRFNLSPAAGAGTFASGTVDNASYHTFSISPDPLHPGTNFLAVEVHQVNTASSDMVFGLRLDALVITNKAASSGVVINEVLARNASLKNLAGRTPGWIEIYNPSSNSVDLAGLAMTRNLADLVNWTFPQGSVINGGGFLVVECDGGVTASRTNTGFSLEPDGGTLFLVGAPENSGEILSSVEYGVQAADWSIVRQPDGGPSWNLGIPTPGAPNRSATLGNTGLLRVNEWMASPADGPDWFEIYNPAAEPVSLEGVGFSDSTTSLAKSRLPALSFLGTGAHAFLQLFADNQPTLGLRHMNFALSANGEVLVITDARSLIIDSLSFAAQARGVSEGRLPDGSANRAFFPFSATPGTSNYLPLENVVVNEVLAHSAPPLEDAVEFFNPSGTAVEIGGWFLSDSPVHLRKYQIPAGIVIPSRGFVVFYENQFNNDALGEPFAFSSSSGDEVYLSEAIDGNLTGFRASAQFGPSSAGVSIGRVETSQGARFAPLRARTFGRNQPATVEEFRLGTGAPNAAPLIGPVVISEIMANPPGGDPLLEFVEVRNVSAASVALHDSAVPQNTWRITGGIEFSFPPGVSLAPGEFLVVVSFNPVSDLTALAAFRSAYTGSGRLTGPFQKHLASSGETLDLQRPDPVETFLSGVPYVSADRVDYGNGSPWPTIGGTENLSLQKPFDSSFGNDSAHWVAAAPTPGGMLPGDADQDGMPDDWEIRYQLQPGDPSDAFVDSDGDGQNNLEEYLAGTNPRDASSVLRLRIEFSASRTAAMQFLTVGGRAYEVQIADSAQGPWRFFAYLSSESGERIETVPVPLSGRAAFFRIELVAE